MSTSPFIMILVSTAALAALRAFALKIDAENGYRGFLRWVQSADPAEWRALPWGARVMFPQAGVSQFRKDGRNRDPEFERRYQAAKRSRKRMWPALLIGIASMGVVALGTEIFGRQW